MQRTAIVSHPAFSSWLRRCCAALLILFSASLLPSLAVAQSTLPAPVILTAPKVEMTDENSVSLMSGRLHMTIPALTLGGLSFTPSSYNGPHFAQGGLDDTNYGRIALCLGLPSSNQGGSYDCSASTMEATLQTILGDERATFTRNASTGVYSPTAQDGSSFVDNGSTCTWTKRDGTQVIYYAFHSTDPRCQSSNVSKIIYPDGRIDTYYYYGTLLQGTQTPIISIASSLQTSTRLLKIRPRTVARSPRGTHVSRFAMKTRMAFSGGCVFIECFLSCCSSADAQHVDYALPSKVIIRGSDIETPDHTLTMNLRDALERSISASSRDPEGRPTSIYIPEDVRQRSGKFIYKALLVDENLSTLKVKEGKCSADDLDSCASAIMIGLKPEN